MNAPIRPALVIASAFFLAACLLGLCFSCNSADVRNFIQERRRREQLQQLMRSSYRHTNARELVVRELLARQCSLSDALARLQEVDREWFRELERDRPDTAIGISASYRQLWSDVDYYYRSITRHAANLLMGQPEEAAAVLRRLEKEYQQLRADRQAPSAAAPEQTERNR